VEPLAGRPVSEYRGAAVSGLRSLAGPCIGDTRANARTDEATREDAANGAAVRANQEAE
jgi:hypothetical protein